MVPRSGRVARDRPIEQLVGGLVLCALLTVVAATASVVVATTTALGALGPATGIATLLALLGAVLGLSGVAAVLAVGLAWRTIERLRSTVRSGRRRILWRLYRRARALEEGTPVGKVLRPARPFESEGPREGPLVEELKARYVVGELDEREFERELARLLGGEDPARRFRRELEADRAGDGEDVVEPEAGEREHVVEPDAE